MVSNWRAWVLCDYWDMLAAIAFGNFRTLLGKVSMHSATGQQLTMIGSAKANPATGQVPDENFALELKQLFTIGLHELNPDGSPKLDASGQAIETYGQSDATNLARVFTGYNLAQAPQIRITQANTSFDYADISQVRLPMSLNVQLHDTDEVRFLGIVIPGGHATRAQAADGARRALSPSQRGPVLRPTDDSAARHEQPQPGICGARSGRVRQQRQRLAW